ncbi:MAG: glycine cleavage system protein H, partial [Elusimicrobia bacterium]|nr:glycine cleavage system protein H [Elusimicrobiota bacterium]
VKVNNDVSKNPAIVNQSPYDNGWLFTVEKTAAGEEKSLMSHAEYKKFLEADEH